MQLDWLERRALHWAWGAVALPLSVFSLVYMAGFASVMSPVLRGEVPSIPPWLEEESTFLFLWAVVAVAVLMSFVVLALSLAHVATRDMSDGRRALWIGIIVAGFQSGMALYWIVNVARPVPRKPRRTAVESAP